MSFIEHYVKIEQCATCRGCCYNIPESICGYNTFEEIHKGAIPEEYLKQMVIYHIAEAKIDDFAKKDNMFPIVNLLRYMTNPKDGYYDFLAYPTVTGNCIMLSEKGCLFPKAKPFECGLHPFYMYKLHFRTDYECQYTRILEDEISQREIVGRFIAEYLLYSEKHQKDYFNALSHFQQKYQLPIVRIE